MRKARSGARAGFVGAALCLLLATGAFGKGRDLTFEQRVAAEISIQQVYYSHQLGTTRPFGEAVPRAALERRVRDYLSRSAALEAFWKTPVTGAMLEAELRRIRRETRMPERLREVFAALGDDPVLILECFARPHVVERLTRNFFTRDERIHGEAAARAEGIRLGLAEGAIDPREAHPLRVVAEGLGDGPADPAVIERPDAFVVQEPLEAAEAPSEVAHYRVPKRTWEAWWEEASPRYDGRAVSAVPGGSIGTLADFDVVDPPPASCPEEDTWDNGSLDDQRWANVWHSAVWTGSLVLVWDGDAIGFPTRPVGTRYDPLTDTWSPMSRLNSPSFRRFHTAIWTGTEMIVWGGEEYYLHKIVDTGGRYDPVTDTWTPTSRIGAPSARNYHTAVWIGTEMLIWGGTPGNDPSGGRYDPKTDTWAPLGQVEAPTGRIWHSAVWTGSEMIVWGGFSAGLPNGTRGDGARYNPATNTWRPMNAMAPQPRGDHSAVWTGSEMIIWAGNDLKGDLLNSGGRYDPVTDRWSPTSEAGAPTPRADHPTIWTGREMLTWGGEAFGGGVPDDEGRYDPVRDVWTPITKVNAPLLRMWHTLAWTGTHLIVWGGKDYQGNSVVPDGGRYDPALDFWTPIIRPENTPWTEPGHTLVWTGSHMIAWGGRQAQLPGDTTAQGARYDPLTDDWTMTSMAGAPIGRAGHTAIWTGERMIVWGGYSRQWFVFAEQSDGGRYDPLTDTWEPVSVAGAPEERRDHAAVWTGREMIVWGGSRYGGWNSTGARYDPVADTWRPTATDGAPSPRIAATAVWTGDRMIVWGGQNPSYDELGTGGVYNPVRDTWQATPLANAPSARYWHSAVWTGGEMIVWGGQTNRVGGLDTGALYDPAADSWRPSSLASVPLSRNQHAAVWTGREMIVWGGLSGRISATNTGGRYDPMTDVWSPTSTLNPPLTIPFETHLGVWTGSQMIVWGRIGGGRYNAYESPDDDGDGVTVCEGDCDDADPRTAPGAEEICDGKDNDCDGMKPTDESDADADGVATCAGDCDDADPQARPGLIELPGDLRDEDCEGTLLCPPDGSMPTHGQLVACVARECARLVGEEVLSRAQCAERVTRAARRQPSP